MGDADTWVKLLYTYGPFALLVFFFAFGETRARSAVKDPKVNKKVAVGVYVANWVVIFVLLGFALSAWYRLTFNAEYTIRGTLDNLQGSETLASTAPELYLHKRYGPQGRFDYEWRLITAKRLAEGEKIPFVLELGTAESEKLRNYEMTIHDAFYKEAVGLRYDRQNDKLILRNSSGEQELQPTDNLQARYGAAPKSYFVWRVEAAQAAQKQVPIQERLEAGDPIIRQQARQELAQQRANQWQYIESTLSNPTSSYRVKLGVISALNDNKCADVGRLSAPALGSVIDASGDADATLRNMARRCLVTQASPSIDAGLDKAIHPGHSTSPRAAELAKTQLEVLYALGVQAKDRYGSRQAQDRPEFDRAVNYFRKAWGLRTLATNPDRVQFAKALYGWGLALHDRSWVERTPTHARNTAYVRAAQQKFSEFLNEVRGSGNANAYPYPQHLRQAAAYLANPTPESLQIR